MNKNKKAKVLRRIRRVPFVFSMFHYGSILIKAEQVPYMKAVHEFFIKFMYEGGAGIVFKPLCDWLWNLEWYEELYKFSGVPSIALFAALTILIRMKEHGGKVVKGNYQSVTSNFGTYRLPKPSVYFQVKNFFRKMFFAQQINLVKEGQNLAVLRVITGNHEEYIPMNCESEQDVTDGVRAIYYKKDDIITLESSEGRRKVLRRNDNIQFNGNVFQFL